MREAAALDTYRFGPFRLDIRERRLLRGGQVIPLQSKAFDTLTALVKNAGRLMTKQELLEAVWPDATVEENNLNRNVSVLRKALGEKETRAKYIETVPKVGYRFAAAIESGGSWAATTPWPGPQVRQEIRYCTTQDGVRLAYASIGSGPPLVKASNWLTHLDFEWDSPIWRHWLTGLSRRHRVIRYDERGNGMSQRDVPDVGFDTWVHDLETVVNAAGLDRFALLGISRGGSIALAYAVRHPERVSHLVLHGAFAAGLNHVGTPKQKEGLQAVASLARLGWGLKNPAFCKMFTYRFLPEATPEQEEWFDELQRVSTSPENAARLLECDADIDVRPQLRQVSVPTLVMHCDRDRAIPAKFGQQLAAEIPSARYVSLPSANHLLLESEPAWPVFLEELERFLH